MRCHLLGFALCLGVLGSMSAARAQDGGTEFFEKKIRPVLVEHCYECHAVGAKKVRGGLLLDSRDGVRKGGVSGPAIEPGDPDKSLLIQAVRYTDETKMPRKGKLPAAIIADLEAWVKMGAPDPRDKAPAVQLADTWEDILRKRRGWWSLQPVRNPAVPPVRNAAWSADPIDRFLLAGMEAKGLTPAQDADPRTLIRRLSLVLTGLPPSAQEVDEFAKAWDDASAKPSAALEKVVDRLLDSPHFGERWARHWMDVIRFTETHGNEWNYEVHHAWRYRDYLIRAFNDDLPYDQFVREHIAGDLLPKPRYNLTSRLRGGGAGGEGAARFNESIIGTAFYRFGEVNHDDCIALRSIGYDLADNQIDTLTKAFQAMTVACARCHDHKLDAISMRDYHGLLGVLRSSRQVSHTIDAPEVNASVLRKMRAKKAAIRRELADAWLQPLDAARLEKVLTAPADEKSVSESPLTWLRVVIDTQRKDNLSLADAWKKVADRHGREDAERAKFNELNFTTLADFRKGAWPDWQVGGHGLRGKPSTSGDFVVAADGDRAISAILPAGAYTHALSEKLNGTLRSPVFTTVREGAVPAEPKGEGSAGASPSRPIVSGKKYISFQVLGDHASAVRLVSNNCQLNYRNYRSLTKNELHWITFPLPADAEGLRVYAELMTKFDNPKFPDQLGQLGGDQRDYRIPWEKAAADPRSHFGVTQVVLHDQPSPPQPELAPLHGMFSGPAPATFAELTARYANRLEAAIRNWRDEKATDDDSRWLAAFAESGLLSNRANLTPNLEKRIAEYRQLDGELAFPRIVPGLADSGPGFEQPIFARGDCLKPGNTTPRRFVEVLAPQPFFLRSSPEGSGRLELANAIAARDNPLTARVMVNRIWHQLFGGGLVRSVDDFGHVGELPSHPELLDYLANRFMHPSPSGRGVGGEGMGWSMKRLIRAIVLTRVFQLSHTPSAAALEADPTNRLLTHYPARRMEAEAIRDSLLTTSGRLDRTLYGLSIPAYREKEYADRRLFKGPLDGNGRRSLYIKVTLMEAPKFLEAFNFPGGKVAQGRRDVTNVPAQALALLNDPFVLQQADVWSKRLIERKGDTMETRVAAMFRTALGREPSPAERERFARFVAQVAALNNVSADGVLSSAAVWRDVGHAMFNLSEFITIP
jgi:hypothetical protein